MTQAPERTLTAAEFALLPQPDAGKMELVDGRVVVHMPVGEEHGAVAANLIVALKPFVRAHKLGIVSAEVGHEVRHDPDSVFAPDVSWTRRAEGANGPVRGFRDRAPDLAIEVKSPHDREPDIAAKVATYLEAGSARVWVVRPGERSGTVTVHRPDWSARVLHGGETLTSDDAGFPVDGFHLPVEEIFEP